MQAVPPEHGAQTITHAAAAAARVTLAETGAPRAAAQVAQDFRTA
jgi:hypothetical protein